MLKQVPAYSCKGGPPWLNPLCNGRRECDQGAATEGRPYKLASKRRDHFFSEPSYRLVIERRVRDRNEMSHTHIDELRDSVAHFGSRPDKRPKLILFGSDAKCRRKSSQQLILLIARISHQRRARPKDFNTIKVAVDGCTMLAKHFDFVAEQLRGTERVPDVGSPCNDSEH